MSASETVAFGKVLFKKFKKGDVIALTGELGAGKTTLIQGIAGGAGVSKKYYVNSPTFTIQNIYEGGKLPIYHFDWYRLSSEGEAFDIGVEEYFNGEGISLVEWAEKFPDILPKRTIWIRLEVAYENGRIITVKNLEEKVR